MYTIGHFPIISKQMSEGNHGGQIKKQKASEGSVRLWRMQTLDHIFDVFHKLLTFLTKTVSHTQDSPQPLLYLIKIKYF